MIKADRSAGLQVIDPQLGNTLEVLDPDLPLLASQAAIELDNLIRNNDIGTSAVKRLSELMINTLAQEDDKEKPNLQIDSGTVAVVGRAFDLYLSRTSGAPKTLEELMVEALKIAQGLEQTQPSSNMTQLETMRAFCASLSQCAGSYIQSIYELSPPHPYRI